MADAKSASDNPHRHTWILSASVCCDSCEACQWERERSRIKSIKVFIADSPEGEGVCAAKVGNTFYPLVSADPIRFIEYLKIAGELVNKTGQKIRVVEFERMPQEAELMPAPTMFPGLVQLPCDHNGKGVYWCDDCGPLDNDHAALLLYRASTALDAAALAFADFEDRFKDDWRKIDREIQFNRFVTLKATVLDLLDAFTKEKMPHCALVDCKIMGPHEHRVEGPGNA